MTGTLLDAHTQLTLEEDSERLSLEQLEPPPFDLAALGLTDARSAAAPTLRAFRRAALRERHRVKRIENLEPVQCSRL